MQVCKVLVSSFILTFCGLATTSPARQAKSVEPITEIKGIMANKAVFKKATREKPIIIGNSKDAKEFFEGKQLAQLGKKIDFEKQVLMIFAWRGSGQDQLKVSVLESFPEQIRFQYTPGRTRDLRPHVYIFAVRNNVIWKGKSIRSMIGQNDLIEMRHSQSGFAGVSGKLWSIDGDGKWVHRTFLNKDLAKPSKTGRLNPMELKSLRSKFEEYKFKRLPAKLGKDPGVNPHTYSIRLGDKTVSMILRGGQQLPSPEKLSGADEKNFARLANLLEKLTTGKAK